MNTARGNVLAVFVLVGTMAAKHYRMGMRLTAQQEAHLSALSAALGTTRTGAVAAVLDLPIGALAAFIQSVTAAQKETARSRRTSGTAQAAASDGVNHLTSDTGTRTSHVFTKSTPPER